MLINVGSNSGCPNGRGRVFDNYTFEYLPIPEYSATIQKVPTYYDLGFGDVKFPEMPVHLDPEFETLTYGHVTRGFGDLKSLLKLKKNDTLFFYSTLQRAESWSTYITGYFMIDNIHDCRTLSPQEILTFKAKGFQNNAHLKRADPSVDLLIKGGNGSKLLKTAFPLAEESNRLVLRQTIKKILRTANGKIIHSGSPWFRWTLTCDYSDQLFSMIEKWNKE